MQNLGMFDDVFFKLLKKERYQDIYAKLSSKYTPVENPLNPQNLISSFLVDLGLKRDFKDYGKIIFSLENDKLIKESD